jgi:hypothetical protein
VQEVEAIPVAPLEAGYISDRIFKDGHFEDLGTNFTRQDIALSHLYCGLAVLARDTFFHLKANSRTDAGEFLRMVQEVNAVEKEVHGDRAFPHHPGFSELEDTYKNFEGTGRASVLPLRGVGLGGCDIVHEWTFKPGKRFFVKVREKCRDTVCGNDGPYEAFHSGDGLLGQANLPSALAMSAAVGAFAPPLFWYPLSAYAGLLILKLGLKTYCEP